MTQGERDRLIVLKKARKGLITQREAALELEVGERQVRRLLDRLKAAGDRSVIHGLKGQPSNRKIDEAIRKRAVEALSDDKCHDFGPTYARDYLASKRKIAISKETVRRWMTDEKLWRAGRRKPEKKPHVWRPRRSRLGELVQWDTSEHDWLEGRGDERLYLIAMIDDATSRLWARFALHDSTEENMNLLETYLRRHGRPAAFYTDQGVCFARRRRPLATNGICRARSGSCYHPRRSNGGCGNWASCGSRRILRRPRGGSKEALRRPRTAW
jgi:transposase